MNGKQLWCNVCERMVEVAIERVATAAIMPLFGGTAGGAIGHKKGGTEGAIIGLIVGALVGGVVNAIVNAFAPKVERIVCSRCRTQLA